jgi:2-keto-4-pentenoate hydratase/2-oxohepta-3-ene-1,7-dioic acid hydratase in catechol pathway
MIAADEPTFALGTFSGAAGFPFGGVVVGDRVVPLETLRLQIPALRAQTGGPFSILSLLEDWNAAFPELRRAVQSLLQDERESPTGPKSFVPLSQLRVHPPVSLPRQVFCAGANYRKHVIDLIVDEAAGTSRDISPEDRRAQATKLMDDRTAHGAPFIFSKAPSAITGPCDPVILPRHARKPDWELELAVIIGKSTQHMNREQALECIAGYTIVNDITDRDLVFRKDVGAIGADWVASKCSPSYMPMGPYLVPAEFVRDPQDLQVVLKLNGQIMQNESTAEMIFGVARILEALSGYVRLWPGDLVATGSPAGNGTHYNRFLKPGDVIEGSITGLGTQRNVCVAEEAEAHAGH